MQVSQSSSLPPHSALSKIVISRYINVSFAHFSARENYGILEAVKNTMLSTDSDSYGSSTNQCLQNRTGAKQGQLKLLLLLHQMSAGPVAQNARETRLTARAVHSWLDESRESRAFVSIGDNLSVRKKGLEVYVL